LLSGNRSGYDPATEIRKSPARSLPAGDGCGSAHTATSAEEGAQLAQVSSSSVREEAPPVYRFGEFTLDIGRGALSRSGRSIPLRPKSFEVLRYLLEHANRLISKDELIEAVWSPAVVTDGALTQCLIDIRRGFGNDRSHLLETVHRRGYVLHADVEVGQPQSSPPARRSRPAWPRLAGGAIAAAIVAVAGWWWHQERAAPAPMPQISIAVMPFADLSPAGDQAYLADGLAEDVLLLLARSPGLHVTARTSSFALRSEPLGVPAIARRLGVAYVLEGSVRRWGDRLRVTAQLIEAETGMHRWSRAYDRQGTDVLALQLEIAAAVADALQVELGPARRQSNIDPRAYALYLQGRHIRHQLQMGTERLVRAESLLKRAIDIQPDFANAHVQLARTYLEMELERLYAPGGMPDIGGIRWESVEAELEKARSIDPNEPDVSLLSGWIARTRDHDWAAAIQHYQRAFEFGPGIPIVDFMPVFLDLYQIDEAIAYGEHLVARDPLCAPCFAELATAYLLAGRLDDAHAANEQFDMLQPGWPGFRIMAAEIATRQGDPARALALFDTLDRGHPARTWGRSIALHKLGRYEEFEAEFEAFRKRWGDEMPDGVAHILARVGDVEAAFRSLNEMDTYVATRAANYHDYYWSELAHDPRWRTFREKWGVAPAQLARYRLNIPIPAAPHELYWPVDQRSR
jgi:TolB-like protein/DNA-binding winged helix-turn-helix (wHTH) protein